MVKKNNHHTGGWLAVVAGIITGAVLLAYLGIWPAIGGALVSWVVGYGMVYGYRQSRSDRKEVDVSPLSSEAANEDRFLHTVVKELSQMQASHDLLERYQSFGCMIEASLIRALGPCQVTLWCPDNRWENLVECVIQQMAGPGTAAGELEPQDRNPQHVPLDSRIIEHALRSQKPYLAYDPSVARLMVSYAPEGSLRSEACIPLERRYGQPLVINVNGIADPTKVRPEDFYLAADLIGLFWQQLQATNQRQWMIEHDQTSRALRDDAFLTQAQQRAERAHQAEQPFAVMVLTLHGFRGMFAGHAHQWRELSGIIGRRLYQALADHKQEFLLGKMADDAFAVLFMDTDESLAYTIVREVMNSLQWRLPQDTTLQRLEVMAVEMRWAGADQRQFSGDMSDMLNRIYRRLFIRGQNKWEHVYHIELGQAAGGVS